LQSLRFAKGADEASTLNPGAPQQAPFGEDDCPRDQAEGKQNDQNNLGDGPGTGKHVENFAADKNCRVGKKMHCDLRDT
jgi:hypothetical protein